MSDLSTYYIDTGDGVTGVRYMADGTSVRRVRPAPGTLLTREEAANDPEVQEMVAELIIEKAVREMQEVTDDDSIAVCPICGGSGPKNSAAWHKSDVCGEMYR